MRPEPVAPEPVTPAPAPAEPPLLIGAIGGDALADAIARELREYLAQQLPGRTVEWGEDGAGAPQVLVTTGAPAVAAGYDRRKLTRLFAPVTNWRLPVRFLERDELTGIFSGAVADWSMLGPRATPIDVLEFTPTGVLPIPGAPRPVAPVATYADYEALVAGLDEHPFGIALVPLDAIDFRVQTLPIGDLDPLAGRGDPEAYPLKRELWLNWEPTLGHGLRDALNAFAVMHGFGDGRGADPVAEQGAPINLTIAGDIIFGRTVHKKMVEYGDWAHPLRGVAPRLQTADLTIANLECSLSDNTDKPTSPTTFLFTTNTAAAAGLTLAGIDGVSLANNHSMNFGKLGLFDTLDVLDQHGITHFGAGADLAAARRPGLFRVKGLTIAFLGYDGISAEEYGAGPDWAGTCPLDRALLVEDIAAAKAAGADLVIPFFHWSEEYVAVPSGSMRRVAHLAIDEGAALVVGSHPHWVQGVEWYKGSNYSGSRAGIGG
ncbi:MAG: CapA family protein [Chloroflexota bacterium]|nr:CapA family protein [Chloroflexota bacterium]